MGLKLGLSHSGSVRMGCQGPQRGEVTADWREVRNEELHDLC